MINPATIKQGDTLVYNDGRAGHCGIKARVLLVRALMMVVQFEDRADTTTILLDDPAWMEHLTVEKPAAALKFKPSSVRVFQEPTGLWHWCDASLSYLDARGKGYPSQAAAMRAARENHDQRQALGLSGLQSEA